MRPLLRRVPKLQRLAVFDAVVTAGSFTGAAEALGISQPAVSRHMTALGRETGIELFERSGRSFALTTSGRILAEAVDGALASVERTIADLVDHRDTFVLAVQPAMATSWVVPLLDQLETAAGTSIQLRIFDRPGELDLGSWDVAIVPGPGDWPEWETTTLFQEVVRPLAAPSLATEFGLTADSEPAALVAANLLHMDSAGRPNLTWAQWFEAAGAEVVVPRPRLVYDAYPTVVQEALAGNGIALGWQHLLSDLVGRGLLVPVGPEVERPDSGHHVCWRTGRADERHRSVPTELQARIAESA